MYSLCILFPVENWPAGACLIFWSCLGPCTWEDKLGMLCPMDPAIRDSGHAANFSNAVFTWAWGVRRFHLLPFLLIMVSLFSPGGCSVQLPVFGGCVWVSVSFPHLPRWSSWSSGLVSHLYFRLSASRSWCPIFLIKWNCFLVTPLPLNRHVFLLAKWNIFLTVY